MANIFNSLKTKASTRKFNLVRIEPARDITFDLSPIGGSVFTTIFAYDTISSVRVNGQEYDLVSSSPASGEFTFDSIQNILNINLGAALTDQVVVVFYYLFYSKEEAQITFEDPLDPTTRIRNWMPRIADVPNFGYNLKDITSGYLSFGSSSMTISNQDSSFEQYVGVNDSFANKDILVWLCLDSVDNCKLVFRGKINRIVVGNKVDISFFDEFSITSKTFFSNGSFISSTYNKDTFPNIQASKENIAIPKVYAAITVYKAIEDYAGSSFYKVDPDLLLDAACISYSPDIISSNNRQWGTILNGGDHGVQTDTVLSVDNSDPTYTYIGFTPGKKYAIGDTIEINPGQYRARINFVDYSTNKFVISHNVSLTSGMVITRPGISVVVITQGELDFYLYWQQDYTISYTGNPNNVVVINFKNNFEASYGGMNIISPDSSIVKFRAWTDTTKSLNHADVMAEMLTKSGFNVNLDSITESKAFDVDTNFYVPYIYTTSFLSFQTYIEDLLQSMLGYLSLNENREIEYHLFDEIDPEDTISSREIILNSFSTQIEYSDIKNSIQPKNPHDWIDLDYSNEVLINNRATYLHEADSLKIYQHILKDTSRMGYLLNLISNRQCNYRFTTKVNPDVTIGDEFILSRTKTLIGAVPTKNVKIISINKKADEVDLQATDLLGL